MSKECWQNRRVEDEHELRIRDALLKALGVEPSDGMVPTPKLVVAASLQRLAVGKGLAQRDDPDQSVLRSADLPPPALTLLNGYFAADGEFASDDDVRNGLCEVLLQLSTVPSALRAMNKTRPLSGTELLEFAQIYWNLDAQEPRHRLPIPTGEMRASGTSKAYIKVVNADEDYAELELKQRADRAPGYKKAGGAFYDRAARLCGLVATRLVDNRVIPIGRANLRSTRTRRGTEWAIIWPADHLPAPKPTPRGRKANAPKGEPDPTVRTLLQLRETNLINGNLGYAAILSTTLIEILRERSERSPGDHESQLAEEYLQAGLTLGMTGHVGEALDSLTSANRMSQMLSELQPEVSLHRFRLAYTRALLGTLHHQVGHVQEAETTLTDAVALSQALTDEDTSHENLLAASLSALGAFYLQTERLQESLASLSRAAAISQKLVKRNPGDDANQLQFAYALMMLGALHIQTDELRAEELLTRSFTMVEALPSSGLAGRLIRLVRASAENALGVLYFFSDRHEEAESRLTAAVVLLETLAEEPVDDSIQLLMSAKYLLGVLYGSTDRGEHAVRSLTEVALGSRDLIAGSEGRFANRFLRMKFGFFLGSALCFLGMIYLELEREQEAEASLVEAVDVLCRRPRDELDQELLAEALELLIDLYHRQGRARDAQRILQVRQQCDAQTPEPPDIV